MSDIRQARKALVARMLDGDGTASHTQRRAAFDNAGLAEPLSTVIDKLTKHAHEVTDADIAAARASGLSEDQIFEIAVCAATGQATRQYETALAALDAATKKE
jgi:alkylhydroperoxidase family enzyme